MKSRLGAHSKVEPTSNRISGMVRSRAIICILACLLTIFQNIPAHAGQTTTGLLVDLNVANPASYSGSGNIVNDLAGTNNSATLVNGPVYQTTGGTGIVTDGVNDYLEIANTSDIQASAGSAFTVQLWAKVNTFTAGRGLFSKQFGASNDYDGYSVHMTGTNALTLNMNGQSVNGNYSSPSNVFTLNTWTLFTAIVRFGGGAGNQSKVYVNSTEVISASNGESGIPSASGPMRIASGIQEGTPWSALKVGAFAMYNRALTPTEITDNYNYYLNYVPDNTAPTITTATSLSALENQTSIATLTASETATWSLRASEDSASVTLNSSTGVLAFKSAPNYERPTDANVDNVFLVTVRATDTAGNFSDASLSISITDLDESTTINLAFSSPLQKGVTTVITASLSKAGKVTITINGKRIPGCIGKASSGSPAQVTCSWKPATTGVSTISGQLAPYDQNYFPSAQNLSTSVERRTGRR